MALNSIEKLTALKVALDMEIVTKIIDEVNEDIKMKIIVLDDYASEIRALKKQLETVRDDYRKELCE